MAVNSGNGNDSITINDLTGVSPLVVTVNGGNGNDRMNGTGAKLGHVRLLVNGNLGNDFITGTEEADTIDSGDVRRGSNPGIG